MLSAFLIMLQACSPTTSLSPESDPEPTQPPSSENATSQPQPIPIEEFVRQTFIEGVPYEEISSNYDSSDVSVLLTMLDDLDEEPYWANIVVALNIVGDEDVVEPVINFINSGVRGTLSYPHFIAKTAALSSMGYLIYRTKSERALNYLIESLDPDIWQERGTTGISPFQTSLEETHMDLSKQALLGLALSGDPQAAEALRSLQASEANGQQAVFRTKVIDLIPEALETNEDIANFGLVNYYRNN